LYFTSCKACNAALEVSWTGQETHPTCPQTPEEIAAREFVDAIQRGDEPEMKRLEAVVNKVEQLPSLGAAALWYAEVARWPVFPLRPGEKVPATRHGFKDATLDSGSIREYWTANPTANIGIPTGSVSGFEVLDIDGPEGFKSVASVADKVPDVHGRVRTPRGEHLLIKPEGNSNRAAVLPGLDVRGEGGYVVAPPSVVNGRCYAWIVKPSPAILGGSQRGPLPDNPGER
jgi:hypothetical protein